MKMLSTVLETVVKRIYLILLLKFRTSMATSVSLAGESKKCGCLIWSCERKLLKVIFRNYSSIEKPFKVDPILIQTFFNTVELFFSDCVIISKMLLG